MSRSVLPRLDGDSPSMEELDRLGWEAGIAFRAYGTRVGVRVNQVEVLDHLESLFPPGWKPAKSGVVDRLYSLRVGTNQPTSSNSRIRWYNLLYANTQRISRTMDLDDLLQVLAADMRLFVAETSETRVFIHAGVVGWRGRAIVLPGKTFSGKSTLVAGLVRAGGTYYSDEYAVFDSRGRVHAFPHPPETLDGERRSISELVEELGVTPGGPPLPVGLVILSEYKRGASWSPHTLSPGQAALALLANTASARLEPQRALETLKRAVGRAPVLIGARGEVDEVLEKMLAELDSAA